MWVFRAITPMTSIMVPGGTVVSKWFYVRGDSPRIEGRTRLRVTLTPKP